MKGKSGDRVVLRHTGRHATIVRLDGDQLAFVKLDGNREVFPVPIEDIIWDPQASAVAGQSKDRKEGEGVAGSFSGQGLGTLVAVALDPEGTSGRKYYFVLINDQPKPLPYEGSWEKSPARVLPFKGELPGFTWRILFEGPLDDLNDHPHLHLKRWHKEGLRQKALPVWDHRFKAKVIVTRQEASHYLPFHAAVFPLPDEANDSRKIPIKLHHPGRDIAFTPVAIIPDPEERAGFATTLDLHIENLVKNPRKLEEAAIFRTQIDAFDRYIQKAIRLGIPRIFIIHGIGTGKLRQYILDHCAQDPHVLRATNNYDPRFGYGATEIVFSGE